MYECKHNEIPGIVGSGSVWCCFNLQRSSQLYLFLLPGLQVSGNSIFMLGVRETLTCSTDLDGSTTEWFYDGKVVVSVSGPEAQLVFSKINDSLHNRNYICRTVTPYGNQQHTVTTLVQGLSLQT